jgi:hypothetical protein
MLRHALLLAALTATITTASGGCRSCDSGGYDYAPPVANCQCDSCGTHRAGSASSGYMPGQPVVGEYSEGEYVEGGYIEGGYPIEGEVMEPAN